MLTPTDHTRLSTWAADIAEALLRDTRRLLTSTSGPLCTSADAFRLAPIPGVPTLAPERGVSTQVGRHWPDQAISEDGVSRRLRR